MNMDTKIKARAKMSKHPNGFFKSIHRLPTKFVKDCGFIPIVLINAASLVEKYIKTEEIFQTQGTASKAYATLNLFSLGKRFAVTRNLSVHDAVEAIKLVLTSLPEPLIPEDVCDALITASRENSADQYGVILGKFRKKSPLNFGILHFMMILLKKVSMHTRQNLMDVRKLATIFVLDVIKPLKLDDPNDGEFLSERMQRLPYLIMVVEKLILNVDIFQTCRNQKPGAAVVAARKTLNEMFLNGAGSGDSRGRTMERSDLNCCESARFSPRNHSSPKWAGHARLKRSNVWSKMAFPTKFLTGSGKERVMTIPQNFAKSSKSVAIFGKGLRSQLQATTFSDEPTDHISHSITKCGSFTTLLDSSGFPLPSRGSNRKAFYRQSRSPKRESKSSYVAQKKFSNENSNPFPDTIGESLVGLKPDAAQVQCGVQLLPENLVCAMSNDKGDGNGQSCDKKGEKQPKQGRRAKLKSGSLPPSTRFGRTVSCTNNLERKGSSPKKKGSVIKSKVNSFRETELRIARPIVKRRSNSVGVLDTRSRLSRSSSQVRRKRKLSLGKKKSRESSVDKLMHIKDDIISPWVNEGITSDDDSLMSRTIRNPRILRVPSSPEIDRSPRRRGLGSPSFDKVSQCLLSRYSDKSLSSNTSFALPSSLSPLRDFWFRNKGLSSPTLVRQRIFSKITLPRVRPDSPERPAPIKKYTDEGINKTPLLSAHDMPRSIQSQDEDKVAGEEVKQASNTQNTLNVSTKQAAANTPQVLKPIEERSMAGGDTSRTRYDEKSPTQMFSLKKPDKHFKNGSALSSYRVDSSMEVGSLSSSNLTSQASSKSKHAQHKTILLQQQPLHLRRVELQHLRQFRIQGYGRQPHLTGATKSKKTRHCSKCACVWALTVAVFLACFGLYLNLYLKF